MLCTVWVVCIMHPTHHPTGDLAAVLLLMMSADSWNVMTTDQYSGGSEGGGVTNTMVSSMYVQLPMLYPPGNIGNQARSWELILFKSI